MQGQAGSKPGSNIGSNRQKVNGSFLEGGKVALPASNKLWITGRPSPPASSSTRVAHQHDGGRSCAAIATAPALPDVGAPCLLTHCAEAQLAKLPLYLRVLVATGHLWSLQPAGLALTVLPARCRDGVIAAATTAAATAAAGFLAGASAKLATDELP